MGGLSMSVTYTKKKKKKFNKENLTGILFILVPLIGFLLFTALSMGVSIYYSFTDFNPIREETKWVWFENYEKLFSDDKFWEACLNTVIFLITIPIGMFIGLLLATYLKKLAHGSKVLRLIYYLPAVSSAVAINIIWRYIFQMDYGIINNILGTNIPWLGTSSKWLIKIAIIIKNIWSSIGGTMLLYLAGLNSISDSYYEAAEMDGATTVEQFFYITMPLVKPTSFYLIITGIIGGLQSYTDAQVFADGLQGARTIVYYIWQYGIDKSKYGLASAASTILGIVIMIITFIQFKKTKMIEL
jgi:multiple sugar transport system permease protein